MEEAIRATLSGARRARAGRGAHSARVTRDADIGLGQGMSSLVLAGRIGLREARVASYVETVTGPIVRLLANDTGERVKTARQPA